MHLFRFKIPENSIQMSVDNEYVRSIYRQHNQIDLEELLIIRQKENVEIFIVGTVPVIVEADGEARTPGKKSNV